MQNGASRLGRGSSLGGRPATPPSRPARGPLGRVPSLWPSRKARPHSDERRVTRKRATAPLQGRGRRGPVPTSLPTGGGEAPGGGRRGVCTEGLGKVSQGAGRQGRLAGRKRVVVSPVVCFSRPVSRATAGVPTRLQETASRVRGREAGRATLGGATCQVARRPIGGVPRLTALRGAPSGIATGVVRETSRRSLAATTRVAA